MSIPRRTFIKTTLLLGAGFAAADAFWLEKFFIETRQFYLGSATKESANIKIVQISDLHLQSVNYQLRQLARQLNKLKPDLILITGDAIDKAGKLSVLHDFLNLIDKEIPKAAITGNWEYWGKVDLRALEHVYLEHNGVLLINQNKRYTLHNKTVSITGVDDFLGGQADFDAAVLGHEKSDYHIVMNHCPQYSDYISSRESASDVAFILSGHTHGGQINLFGFIPFLPQGSGRYVKGWYNDKPAMYVSKGIGTSILPARFGARAEIAVFNLPV